MSCRKDAGRAFHKRRPATLKLLSLKLAYVRGTARDNEYTMSTALFVVALCNSADHYIFMLFLSSFFSSSPNLSIRRLDVYYTLAHGVALVRI